MADDECLDGMHTSSIVRAVVFMVALPDLGDCVDRARVDGLRDLLLVRMLRLAVECAIEDALYGVRARMDRVAKNVGQRAVKRAREPVGEAAVHGDEAEFAMEEVSLDVEKGILMR